VSIQWSTQTQVNRCDCIAIVDGMKDFEVGQLVKQRRSHFDLTLVDDQVLDIDEMTGGHWHVIDVGTVGGWVKYHLGEQTKQWLKFLVELTRGKKRAPHFDRPSLHRIEVKDSFAGDDNNGYSLPVRDCDKIAQDFGSGLRTEVSGCRTASPLSQSPPCLR
jgi:hypothetical protein